MRFLLDTSVASMLAPERNERLGSAIDLPDWFDSHEPDMLLSVMTIQEIESGIHRLTLAGATRRRGVLSDWLSGLIETFRNRILPVDLGVALTAGRLEATAIAKGQDPGLGDVIIAATAETHDLTVLTRNLRHFIPLGVPSIDPFKTRPPSGPR